MSVFAKTSLFAALAATLALTGPASAEPAYDTHTTTVSTAGLDLSTPQGVAALDQRIHSAAVAVCGKPDYSSLQELAAIHDCRVNAIQGARAAVQHAVQTAQASHLTTASLR